MKLQPNPLNRRMFLMAGGAMMTANAAPSATVTLGLIGAGSRGSFVMQTFQKDPALRIGAICDVYEPNLEKALSIASKVDGNHPKAYRNYKQLLADKDIEAVYIATPEHWHAQMVLDALAAGKDIYVEKPLCRTPEEGVKLLEAEKHTRQIIQVGMQRRSYDLFLEGRDIVKSGKLGAVRMVRSWWLNNNLNAGKNVKLEGLLDWEQWQGPTVHRPLDPARFKYWRYYSDYSGGMFAEQGVHVYDGIHLLMGASYPTAVNASGGKSHRNGPDTPDSMVAIAEYPEDFIGVFSINYAAMQYEFNHDQLNQLDGDHARMDIGRDTFRVFMKGAEEQPAMETKSPKGFLWATDLHVQNFLECVRTRKTPTAPMRIAFPAALTVQMANLSLKQGRRLKWNASTNRVEA